MASITSLSNSSYNTSSIYGNRNILTGLASGMDTESMIENAVSGIKLKIQNLVKKRTKVEWQQEAYRSIIDKAVNFNNKYTSYSSKTNLLSSSFFNNAVNTAVNGTYKDKITASGKTTSDIKINAVKQMAKAASYTVSGLGGKFSGEINGIQAAKGLDLSAGADPVKVSNVSGTLSIQYGSGNQGASFDVQFDELEDIMTSGQDFADAINKKLSEITYSYTDKGFQETTTADKAVQAVYENGKISFKDVLGKGNKVTVGSVSGSMGDTLGIGAGDTTIRANDNTNWVSEKPTSEYLGGKKGDNGKWTGGKELSVTFNGTTKKINMSDVLNGMKDGVEGTENARFMESLQGELDKAFGVGKIEATRSQDGKLSLTPSGVGDTLALSGAAVKALGFTEDNTNYVNTGKKLSELMGDDFFKPENRLKAAEGAIKESSDGKYSVDSEGNRVSKGDDGKFYRVNSDGEFLYDFKINDANINVTKDTTLESLMNSINSNADAGAKVSYSKLTNEFKFTATEMGSSGRIEFGGMAADLFGHGRTAGSSFADTYQMGVGEGQTKEVSFNFGKFGYTVEVGENTSIQDVVDKLNKGGLPNDGMKASYDELSGQLIITDQKTGKMADYKMVVDGKERDPKVDTPYVRGQDAVMDVEINGKRFENLTRSSNSFDLDGLTVNVKGEFNVDGANAADKDGNAYEAITFNTTTDSDKIVETIRQFVDDYNEMATELKNAYTTMPAQNSNGARYEPLTAEEEEKYSESELKAYNEKAKQGILFGDTTLSSMYSKLLSAIQPGGVDGQTLREIGIGTSYSNGMTTLSLDEDKLRAALESDPDKVKNAFTKTREGGSTSDGLMQTMQNTLNTYVKTTGEPKGVLIQRAGSVKAYTSLNSNSLKSQIDSIDSQIERWQDKMSSQIDRYTTQFSRLEQLIAQMNSQSSAFAGLMGGSTGY